MLYRVLDRYSRCRLSYGYVGTRVFTIRQMVSSVGLIPTKRNKARATAKASQLMVLVLGLFDRLTASRFTPRLQFEIQEL